ncbi:MAG: LysR family transcriptional regulator [Methyloligellaceae bacterium]
MHIMHLKELDANLVVVLDALLIDASVTKAAERLGRSPSAVSHALANLREIFEDKLFVRAGQRLVPTAKATSLAPTIHVIVSGMESLLRPETPFDPAIQERNFSLACRGTFELTLLHELRNSIRDLAPNITINWKPLAGLQNFEDLRQGRSHFLISEGKPVENAADFESVHLNDDEYVTLANKKHPMAGKEINAENFSNTENILFASSHNTPFEQHLEMHDIQMKHTLEVSSAFVGLFIALESNAFVTLPASVVEILKNHVPFAVIKQPFPTLSVSNHLCWHRSHDRDECHEWVRNKLIELVK